MLRSPVQRPRVGLVPHNGRLQPCRRFAKIVCSSHRALNRTRLSHANPWHRSGLTTLPSVFIKGFKAMAYEAASARYSDMQYRVCGKSGLKLPALSLGLWHNFGDTTPLSTQRDILRTAFDLGITHFDLANNYGPPYGSAETNFGRLFKDDFKPYRDELLISSKAGWDMWPGPYGQGGGSRKYILASLDQSLQPPAHWQPLCSRARRFTSAFRRTRLPRRARWRSCSPNTRCRC
jgi:hypothetical protein